MQDEIWKWHPTFSENTWFPSEIQWYKNTRTGFPFWKCRTQPSIPPPANQNAKVLWGNAKIEKSTHPDFSPLPCPLKCSIHFVSFVQICVMNHWVLCNYNIWIKLILSLQLCLAEKNVARTHKEHIRKSVAWHLSGETCGARWTEQQNSQNNMTPAALFSLTKTD